MCEIQKQARRFSTILAILASAVLLMQTGCREEGTSSSPQIDLTPFKEMASVADCADMRNQLYLIDGRSVFWDREGNCPDNAYSMVLFGGTVNDVICYYHDSIAGPIRSCRDDSCLDIFSTMIAAPGEPDLGLGQKHTVQSISF